MGYRASIKNINSIGHLINGNICTFILIKNIVSHGKSKASKAERQVGCAK